MSGFRNGVLLGAALFAAALPAHAGTFVIGSASGVRNEEVVVPIQYQGDGTSVDAMLDLTFNGMYLSATGAQGANGGDCAVMPGFLPNNVRVLAPDYTGLPLESAATDICYVTLRIEPSPPTSTLNLFQGPPPICVADSGAPLAGCVSTTGAVTVLSVVSKPASGSTITFVGDPGATIATRTITVINTHPSATQSLSNCAFFPAGDFTLAPFDPNIDAGGGTRNLVIDCTLPPPDVDVTAILSCSTSDPSVSSLKYALACVAAPLESEPKPDDALEASTGDAGDRFGASLALTDLGATEIVVVGAPDAGDGGGQVYVFEKAPGGTLEEKRLTDRSKAARILRPLGKAIGDKFGEAVAVSPDGTFIAVGSPEGGSGNGVVTVYQRPGTNWSTPATLAPVAIAAPPTQGTVTAAGFGASLAFATGNTLVIGADKSNVAGTTNAGAAFVYSVGGGSATQLGAPMAPPVPEAGGRFGRAMAGTSSFVAVGAPGEGSEAGAVYAYQTTPAGAGAGTRSTRSGGAIGDKWGSSVSAAGGIVVVGAPDANTTAGAGSGLATVLLRGAGTNLLEHATLLPESGAAQGAGASVATNGDVVVLGAPIATVNSLPSRGRAFLYDLGAAQTAQSPDVAIDPIGGAANDRFGGAVSIGFRRLLIGIPNDDDELAPGGVQADAGSVDPYVLDRILRQGFE